MVQQLAMMLLIQGIRLYLAQKGSAGVGWLFALVNKRLTAALRGMHQSPAYCWTLQSLAERTGLSRTSFAVKLERVFGALPWNT